VQFRLPEELRSVEPVLRELIQARVGRARWKSGSRFTPADCGRAADQRERRFARGRSPKHRER